MGGAGRAAEVRDGEDIFVWTLSAWATIRPEVRPHFPDRRTTGVTRARIQDDSVCAHVQSLRRVSTRTQRVTDLVIARHYDTSALAPYQARHYLSRAAATRSGTATRELRSAIVFYVSELLCVQWVVRQASQHR